MDFELTQEQQEYRRTVIRFAQMELNDDVVDRDHESTFSQEAWKKCAHFGIQGLPIPDEYGGEGADPLTIMVAMEALGYGCKDNGLIFSMNAQMWSCELPIIRFGTEEQKRRYLPGLCDGSLIGVQGMTEPGSGSDAFSLTTRVQRKGARYILDGSKTFITNAPIADVFVVFASSDPGAGFAGLCAFIVERSTPGLTVGAPFHKMGLRTSPMSELFLDECEVGEGSLLGRPGAGMAIFNTSMDWERSCILASAVGTMHRQLEKCIAYVVSRRQFGQSIGKFQAVSHKLVDMKIRLETARLLVYQLGWLKSKRRSTSLESAIVKLYLSECFVQSSLDALHTHGAYGYMTDGEFERDVRDAIGSRIYSGTSEIQRNIIASHMGL